MAKIRVDTTGVAELRTVVGTVNAHAGSAQSFISQARNGMDMKTAASENISYRINNLYSRLRVQQEKLRQYETALENVNERFLASDRIVANQAKEVNFHLDRIIASPVTPTRDSLNVIAEKLRIKELLDLFYQNAPGYLDTVWKLLHSPSSMIIFSDLLARGGVAAVDFLIDKMVNSSVFDAVYDEEERELNGHIFKRGKEVNADTDYLGGNIYVGKVKIKRGTVDFDLLEDKTKKELNDGKWEEKETQKLLRIAAELGASISVLYGDAKISAGDEMRGAEVKAEGGLGNAKIGGEGKLAVGEDGVDAYIKGEAVVSAAEGQAKGTLNIMGLKITIKAKGYAGAFGAEGTVGFKDGAFVAEGGAAALFGVGTGVEIGINETGWNNFMNFVDFLTFWD